MALPTSSDAFWTNFEVQSGLRWINPVSLSVGEIFRMFLVPLWDMHSNSMVTSAYEYS
jgi:hypothetical protein